MASSEQDDQERCHGGALRRPEAESQRELARKQLGGERRSIDAGFAHRGERRREVALGEAAAILVGDQRMVEIGRLGQAEQLLQQALDRRRRAQVGAAHDHGHAARRIVDDA